MKQQRRTIGLWLAAGLMALTIALLLLVPLSGGGAGGGFGASEVALADIPANYLAAYQRAGEQLGLDWTIIAAIGKVESDHGRINDLSMRLGWTNSHGCCAGPGQFCVIERCPNRGRTKITLTEAQAATWKISGRDGNDDGIKNPWEPADAILATATDLKKNGAPKDYRKAIFAYNRANWYVDQVLAQADTYRKADAASAVDGAGVEALPTVSAASLRAVLTNPRIELQLDCFAKDLANADPRILALLSSIARGHTVLVSSIKCNHAYLTAGGNVSAHSAGRAFDLAAVDGSPCTNTATSSPCGRLARALARITGPLQISQVIFCFDADGPAPTAFAQADHCDHIHAGF